MLAQATKMTPLFFTMASCSFVREGIGFRLALRIADGRAPTMVNSIAKFVQI